MTKKMNALTAFLLAAGALSASVMGCELIASVDRNKIPGGGGAGGSGGATTSTTSSTSETSSTTSSTSTGMCSGAMSCTAPGDCPAPADDCVSNTCDNGCCGTTDKAAGQTCTANGGAVCDGSGKCVACVAPSDCPMPTTACKSSTCDGNACGTMDANTHTTCNDNGGRICDGAGTCVQCNVPVDCPDQTTTCKTNTCDTNTCGTSNVAKGTACSDNGGVVCDGNGACVATHCNDGVMDADETDKDCGGTQCGPCADTLKCSMASDCQSKVCDSSAHTCTPPSCTDGVQNGTETDTDCGGSCTAKCADKLHCSANSDCANNFCFGSGPGTCVSCADGVKDGNETDTDCGGPQCDAQNKLCGLNKGCTGNGDCQSGDCQGGTTCVLKPDGTTCSNNNQCSSTVCGVSGSGNCCASACLGGSCGATSCNTSGACVYPTSSTSCGAPACSNGQLTTAGSCNGSGTCNAGTTAACAGGLKCASTTACLATCSADTDCQSSTDYCSAGTCKPKGGAGATCAGNNQCSNGICDVSGTGHCCSATCTTGGTCGATSCNTSGACVYPTSSTSCGSASCSNGQLTAAASCSGTGTCNAGTAAACPGGLKCASATACLATCSADTDCQSSSDYCSSGTCVPKGGAGAVCGGNNQCSTGKCGTTGSGHCCSTTCSALVAACGATDCDTSGACSYPGNTTAPASLQTPGNCQKIVCNGSGNSTSADDATDLPTSNTVCQINPACVGPSPLTPGFTNVSAGTDCTADNQSPSHVCGSGVFAGTCVQCNVDADCIAINDAGTLTCNTTTHQCE